MKLFGFRDREPGLFFPFGVPAPAATGPASVSGAVLLGGWSFIETTGAATAQLDLIDGGPNGGSLLVAIQLAAGASIYGRTPGKGLVVQSGLFVQVNSGSVRGSLWLADL